MFKINAKKKKKSSKVWLISEHFQSESDTSAFPFLTAITEDYNHLMLKSLVLEVFKGVGEALISFELNVRFV